MRQGPFEGQPAYGGQRQGFRFNPRLLILLLFAGYAAYYWMSNRSTDRSEEQRVGTESRSRWSPYH